MSHFVHHIEDWPRLCWSEDRFAHLLPAVRLRRGRLLRRMESVGFDLQEEAVLQSLTRDVVESSSIEGERLDKAQARSSLTRRLGMDANAGVPAHRTVEGVVAMMLNAARLYAERLFGWKAALFPTGRRGLTLLRTGGLARRFQRTDGSRVRPRWEGARSFRGTRRRAPAVCDGCIPRLVQW